MSGWLNSLGEALANSGNHLAQAMADGPGGYTMAGGNTSATGAMNGLRHFGKAMADGPGGYTIANGQPIGAGGGAVRPGLLGDGMRGSPLGASQEPIILPGADSPPRDDGDDPAARVRAMLEGANQQTREKLRELMGGQARYQINPGFSLGL